MRFIPFSDYPKYFQLIKAEVEPQILTAVESEIMASLRLRTRLRRDFYRSKSRVATPFIACCIPYLTGMADSTDSGRIKVLVYLSIEG